MKKDLPFLIVCAFVLFFTGCKEKDRKAGADTDEVKTITLSSIEESFQDTSYFKDPQVVVLETRDESLLSEMTRIFMDEGKLFIFDDKLDKVVIFDTSGKYLGKIDCKGEGPREYIQITDFTIAPADKLLVLLCDIPYKQMYFTYDGEFVNEVSHPGYFDFTMDDRYVYFNKNDRNGFGNKLLDDSDTKKVVVEEELLMISDDDDDNADDKKPEYKQLVILDTKTGETQEDLPMPDIKNSCALAGNSFSRGKNILFVRRYDNSIYELKEGKVGKKYQVDFKNHTFPARFIAEGSCDVIFEESRKNGYIYSMSNAVENDNHMLFYTNMGVFLYDKNCDVLTGYKTIRDSYLNPVSGYMFSDYLPLENTDKIVLPVKDPSFIKNMAEVIIGNPDKLKDKIKKMKDEYPESIEKVLSIANKMSDDNNPVLFIYEFKD